MICRTAPGITPQQHADTLIAVANLRLLQGRWADAGDRAREIFIEPLSHVALAPATRIVARTTQAAALIESNRDYGQALSLLASAEAELNRGMPDRQLLLARVRLWQSKGWAGKSDFDRALDLMQQSRRLFTAELGQTHPETMRARQLEAEALNDVGRYTEAEAEARGLAIETERVLGPRHALLARMLLTQALALQLQHDDQRAMPLLDRAVEIARANPESEPYLLIRALGNHASAALSLRRPEEARTDFRLLVSLCGEKYGARSVRTAYALWGLGNAERLLGDLDAARTHLLAARRMLDAVAPDNKQDRARLIAALGDLNIDAGQIEAAITSYKDAMALSTQAFGAGHSDSEFYKSLAGSALVIAGRVEAGRALIESAVDDLTRSDGQCGAMTRAARQGALDNLTKRGHEGFAFLRDNCAESKPEP